MPLLPVWPSDVIPAKDIKWWVVGEAANGPRAIGGRTRRGRTDGGGYWMCSMSGAALRNTDAVRLGRALEALCQGGITEIIVPACECAYAPVPLPRAEQTVPHSDDTTFSDGSEYFNPRIDATFGAAAALRATRVRLKLTTVGELRGGEQFSVQHADWDEGGDDKRMYRIFNISDVDNGMRFVDITPPLRAAVDIAADADFDNVGCVMRLTNPDEVMAAVSRRRFSELNPVFEEAFQ